MLKRANIVLPQGRHRGIDDYMDYLLELLNSLYESVIIEESYRADAHNYVIDGNIPNEDNEIRILASAGVVIIFVASEWPKFFQGVLYFNTFQHRNFLASRFLRRLSKKRRGSLTHRALIKLLDEFLDIRIDMLYFYANRAEEFQRNFSYYTAVIGPSKDLVKPYSDFFGVPAFAIEPLFEENKFLDKKLESPPKIFFSGNLTKHRQVVLSNMQKVHSSLDIEYLENSTSLSAGSFTHELYIPQQFRWPYSSPIRTYRTYRQGFIPINFDSYTQSVMDAYLPILSDTPESRDSFLSYTIEKLIEGAKASNAIREEQIKTYQEYLTQEEERSQNKNYKSMRGLQLIAEGYKDFNILALGNQYYAIPQGEGGFNLHRIENENYSASFTGESESAIRRQIEKYDPKLYAQIKEIKKAYKGFNIMELKKKYYAIPQGEGRFDLKRFEQKDYSAFFTSTSESAIRRQITEYIKEHPIKERSKEDIPKRSTTSSSYISKSKIQVVIEDYLGKLIANRFYS